ncbi:MAG: hypothetical protein JNL58_21305 [Planctomyces sp.]|nr:hypothetical protein [Planctomyces sp.]
MRTEEGNSMSYRQLFLLILTIWSAELCTRFLFDALLPMRMEFRTLYLSKDDSGFYKGSDLKDLGNQGWQMVTALPNPDNKDEMMFIFQRRSVLTAGN